MITNQMDIKADAIFCSNNNTCAAYYSAWQSFRNIALGLMVIAGLVMIIAQALGMELLDAYTIRKVLPRLLIAAVGITLSWALMRFLVQLSDDLGFGIRFLIYQPFSHLSSSLNLSFSSNAVANFFAGGAALGATGLIAIPAWIALGGPAALLAYAGTAALAVLVAILVLILRQIAIIMLLLLSPIAIVAYILPNTQRIYKLWWDTFSKALLMFPMIAAFIATGRVFSAISINNGGGINQFIGFVAYFAPYFMIPMTFRMAGAAVGGMGNLVQGRAQGGFKALQGVRANQRKSRMERARGAGLYRKKTGLPGFLNKVGFYSLDADEQLPYDLGSGSGVGKLTSKIGSKKLFGRMAGEMGGQKAMRAVEHTDKAAQQANLHYSSAWAALGMREKLASGLTAEGLSTMDEKYGLDEDGNRVSESGKRAVRWQAPRNADFEGLHAYASDLGASSLDGSQAQYASQELGSKAGLLSSFGLHMDTQRATLESVAGLTAAKEGKLSAEDLAHMRNHLHEEANGDPYGEALASMEMSHLESSATQQRQDLRRGKGVKIDSDGQAYSVWGNHKLTVPKTKDGQPVYRADGSQETETIEAYQSKEAEDALMTAKAGSVGMGKGEYYDDTREAYKFHGGTTQDLQAKGAVAVDQATGKQILSATDKYDNGDAMPVIDISKLSPQQRELRKTLAVQAGIYAPSDPGAKVKLEQTMHEMGITQEERRMYMMEARSPESMGIPGAGGSGGPGGGGGGGGGGGP